MNEIEAVIETGIYVDDLERTEAFYRDVLGLTVIGKEPDRHVFFRVGQWNVLLAFNATATLKGDMLPAHGAKGPGHFALGIAVADFDAWRDRLLAHGVVIEKYMQWPRGRKPKGGWKASAHPPFGSPQMSPSLPPKAHQQLITLPSHQPKQPASAASVAHCPFAVHSLTPPG